MTADTPADTPADAPADTGVAAEADVSAEAAAGTVEEIVVTGSAIRRRDLVTPAPLTIVDRVELEATGQVSLGEILQSLPSQSAATNVQVNNGGEGSTRLNLRGLGPARTLVLLNGRRHVPGGTGANSAVDINTIPAAIVERVEVLKDGASAVYGSDAISGVVNIITRRRFAGVEATAYTGVSQRGDAFLYDLSATAGHNADRGNILFSANYYTQNEAMAGDREFSEVDTDFDWETREESTLGSSSTPQGWLIDREGDSQPGNAQWQAVRGSNPANTSYYNDPTQGWRVANPGGTSDTGEGDLYNYQPENYLLTPQQRYGVFSTGDYSFHERVRGYFESSYVNRRSDQLLAPEPIFTIGEGITIGADSVYNPFGRSFRDVRRRIVETGGRRFLQDIDTFRTVVGAEAQLSDDWSLDVSFNFGRTEATDTNQGRLVLSRLNQALGPSFIDPATGTPTCGTPDAPIADCVPLDFFGGEGAITQEMLDFVTYTGIAKGFNDQKQVLATASGKLFDLPSGGPIGLAVGAGYRSENGGYQPDPNTASGNTTGNKGEPTLGGYDVVEGYAELSANVIQGLDFIETLEVQGAVRAFNYDTFGSGTTWKAGARWQVIPDVAVRGTVSTAFRAPSIPELFSGQADDFPSVTDPCDTSGGPISETAKANCMAEGVPANHSDNRSQLQSLAGGNTELEPETANVFTVGTVLQPSFVEGLSLTLDYFNIKIDNSIQRAGADVILSDCYNQANPDRDRCRQLIQRDDTGLITVIIDTFQNLGGAETAGLDVSLGYRLRTADAGNFRFSVDGTFLQKFDTISQSGRRIKGRGVYDLQSSSEGGGVHPDFQGLFMTVWNYTDFGANLGVRYVHSFIECEDNDCGTFDPTTGMTKPRNTSRDVPAYATVDAAVNYNLNSPLGLTRLTLGGQNLFDIEPRKIYNGFTASSDPTAYDFIGRFFYARLTQAF